MCRGLPIPWWGQGCVASPAVGPTNTQGTKAEVSKITGTKKDTSWALQDLPPSRAFSSSPHLKSFVPLTMNLGPPRAGFHPRRCWQQTTSGRAPLLGASAGMRHRQLAAVKDLEEGCPREGLARVFAVFAVTQPQPLHPSGRETYLVLGVPHCTDRPTFRPRQCYGLELSQGPAGMLALLNSVCTPSCGHQNGWGTEPSEAGAWGGMIPGLGATEAGDIGNTHT